MGMTITPTQFLTENHIFDIVFQIKGIFAKLNGNQVC